MRQPIGQPTAIQGRGVGGTCEYRTLNGRSPHTTLTRVAGILLATVNPCLAPLSRRHTDTRPAAAPTLAAGLPIA